MKTTIVIVFAALLSVSVHAQIDNPITETIKVFGNCGMCEGTIEKAGTAKKLYKTDWNVDTKLATITFRGDKTTLDEVLKNIALAGYDNAKYLAPDDAYAKLHGCCKYDRENKRASRTESPGQANTHNVNNHSVPATSNKDNLTVQDDPLLPVFTSYFELKDALVKSDASTAAKRASGLLDAVNGVKMGSLKDNDHTIWMKVRSGLMATTESIKESTDLEVQRNRFMSLSQHIYELIKSNQPKGTVYYQFCPMANDGKGANWLSKESSIRNPYYGSQMLTCGKTIETIKQ